jgi:phthalate 4,5-dioxygenase oxygenase subunit
MLSRAANDTLTRVGPGTPMGDMLRRYWTPALLSSELPGGLIQRPPSAGG